MFRTETYSAGLSLVNMFFVGVAIILYIFALTDMNRTVKRSREMELEFYRKEKEQKHAIFEQTAEALASAIDAKDRYIPAAWRLMPGRLPGNAASLMRNASRFILRPCCMMWARSGLRTASLPRKEC